MSPRIGPSGPLSRDRIVAAAIEVADAVGLDAMTMKRVADLLDAGVMSLYRHVADKDELVGAMVERVTEDYAYPDQTGLGWREAMHTKATRDWASYLAHPWMLAAVSTLTPPRGQATLLAMEWSLTGLTPLGLSPLATTRAMLTIDSYIQGSARLLLSTAPQGQENPGHSWRRSLADLDLEAFPKLRQLVDLPLTEFARDWFDEGLELVLDGVAASVRTHGGG